MNQRTVHLISALSVCQVLLIANTALAWNSAGHMIIALVAYDEMSDAAKTKAIELLRAHPRFDAHFERLMPREVSRGNDAEKAQWFFAHAGTWPDLVRSPSSTVDRQDVSRFSRPYWHYINQPIFLNDAERHELESGLRLYVNRQPPQDPDESSMNVIQAVKNSSRIVGDANAPTENRSVHLCWLIHLVGDSHQPLHSAALYTANRFPGGDHGGNYLEIEHDWKLHAFWDDQVCSEEPYETIRSLAADVRKNVKKSAAGRKAAASIDIENWIDESHQFAKRYAYSEEVLKKVADREGHTHLGPLDLSPEYKANAESLSERRATEAAYRLAKLLEQLLK
jgi:hypothetical protein